MGTVIAVIEALPLAVKAGIAVWGVGATIYAAIQQARKKHYLESLNQAVKALGQSDDALLAVVAALQESDHDGKLKPTKDAIQRAAIAIGVEAEKLGPLVDQVRDLLKSDTGQNTLTAQKAVAAARAAREAGNDNHE
ncbi:hypothetical protein HQ520_14580 [bacterium]|nr:hypothetical protein [bacterium]